MDVWMEIFKILVMICGLATFVTGIYLAVIWWGDSIWQDVLPEMIALIGLGMMRAMVIQHEEDQKNKKKER